MSANQDGSTGHASAAQGGIDAVKELRSARFGPSHLLLTVAVLVANVFDGYDTLNPSYVISYTAKPWHLSHSASGFMVSAGLIGFMIGALAHGPIVDRIGRRPVLLSALCGAGIFSVLTATMAHRPPPARRGRHRARPFAQQGVTAWHPSRPTPRSRTRFPRR